MELESTPPNSSETNLSETFNQVRDRLGGLDERLRSVAREHPALTLFGAVVSCFLIGRLVARR